MRCLASMALGTVGPTASACGLDGLEWGGVGVGVFGGVLLVFWWCFGGVLGGVLLVFWRCFGGVLVVFLVVVWGGLGTKRTCLKCFK